MTANPSSFEAKERLREALALDGLADADAIEVQTDGTRVTLTGTVGSREELDQAGRAAWSIPGVTEVDNLLRVV